MMTENVSSLTYAYRLLHGHRLTDAGDDPALVKWYTPSRAKMQLLI
jgi:hypothetical protein